VLALQPALPVPVGFPVSGEIKDGTRHEDFGWGRAPYPLGTVMSMSGASGCFMPTML
jgi:hypothetical protein